MASNGIIVLEGDAVPTGGVPPPLEENEKMAYIKQRVQLFINSRPSEGPGTLYLTTENLVWQKADQPEVMVTFHWRQVLMHAVSRDTSYFPHPCIYCQIKDDAGILSNGNGNSAEEDNDEADVEVATQDVRYVFDDPDVLAIMFTVYSQCQALHPDQEEGEGDFMFDEDEVARGAGGIPMMNVTDMTQADQEALNRWDALLTMPTPGDVDDLTQEPDRFADAEED